MNPALSYLVKHGAANKLLIPCRAIGSDPTLTVPIINAIVARKSSLNIFTRCRVVIREKIPAGFVLIVEKFGRNQRVTPQAK